MMMGIPGLGWYGSAKLAEYGYDALRSDKASQGPQNFDPGGDERRKNIQEFVDRLLNQSTEGSQAMFQGRQQDINQRYGQRSRGMIADAARRGALHSGSAQALSRGIERDRGQAMTAARGSSQQFLMDALSRAAGMSMQSGQFDAALWQDELQRRADEDASTNQMWMAILGEVFGKAGEVGVEYSKKKFGG